MSKPKMEKVKLFDDIKYGFVDIVQHYNSVKVGYDEVIASKSRYSYASHLKVTTEGGIDTRYPWRLSSFINETQSLRRSSKWSAVPSNYLAFTFSVPVRKGYEVEVTATLTPYGETTPIAKTEEHGYFKNTKVKSDALLKVSSKDAYGFFPIILKDNDDLDLENPATFLQEKIKKKLRTRRLGVAKRLFLLRVQQLVWPYGKNLSLIHISEPTRPY